ncbi:hypothetical protein [Bacillus sp. FJAT-27251]|uniref:hypothetical protein n=1 Tax=Bacillus sp. FJAT-27251 TaxID=1684142 RepID=UPI0006A79D71|nr:hypothetical protein [Bacillus sp. FJAT-27251]
MNYIERSIALNAGLDQVTPGERVTFEPDYVYLSGSHAKGFLLKLNEAEGRTGKTGRILTNLILEKDFASFPGWSRLLNDSSNHIIKEEEVSSLAKGSSSLLVAGADPRTGAAGARGAIPILLSPAALYKTLLTGKAEVTIPDTIYIELNGYNKMFNIKGLDGYLEDYFKDSLVGCGVIIGGEAIRNMGEDEKLSILSFLYEMGVSVAVYSAGGALGQVDRAIKVQQHILEKQG